MSPPQTIFEINASSRDLSSQVMRAKRQKDCKAIASFQQGRQERKEGLASPAPSCPAQQEEQPEEAAQESVEVQPHPGPWRLGLSARRQGWGPVHLVGGVPGLLIRPLTFDLDRGFIAKT